MHMCIYALLGLCSYLSRKPASPIVNSAIGCATWHRHFFSTMNELTTFH
jgi:hypothetical protein